MILIQPSIDPVILSIGALDIRWYSLSYIMAFVIGSFLIKKFNKEFSNSISNKEIDNFFLWAILGVIIGGRLGYVIFYQTNIFVLDPIHIFKIWKGGMSFHGGLAGMIVSIYFFCRKNKLSFFYLADLVSLVAPIGLFFGRIANFINTELYGRITDFPFAVIYPSIDQFPRHPSQLYEAFFEGFLLFTILLYYFYKKKENELIGKISGLFLLLYSFFRFSIEYLREPDAHLGLFLGYFSMGQLLSVPLFIFGILIFVKK
tara:strand:+ start:349 stop:1125 length:777 start_codon:yes stop_codon:yes gene_type:complete